MTKERLTSIINTASLNPNSIGDLTHAERNLLSLCRALQWGEIRVQVKRGEPVMVSSLKQDIKLDLND